MDNTKTNIKKDFLYPKNAVAGIIIVKNKFLLQHRDNKNNIFFPNFWGLFGGAIDENEKYSDGLNREIQEELNLNISHKKKKFITNTTFQIKNKKIERHVYSLEISTNEFKHIKINEGQNFKLFTKKELERIKIVPYDHLAVWIHINLKRLKA